MIDFMMSAACFVSARRALHLSGFVSFCRGLRNTYFAVSRTFGRSTVFIFSERYSITFSLLSFLIPTVNDVISESETLSFALSKNLVVNTRNRITTIPRTNTANVAPVERTTHDTMSPRSEPIP